MAYAAAISTVIFIYFTAVIASHETCNMAVLTDTQLRQEIRNEVNGVKLYFKYISCTVEKTENCVGLESIVVI